ncbi:MAG: TIGR03435 family protein [Terracidiphilus sp.]|nr:TIGR03435 family protein [Terracidiphilus sp.]MDR3797195.1 TIGR03435 family protein [Terracidiphilus sp.]
MDQRLRVLRIGLLLIAAIAVVAAPAGGQTAPPAPPPQNSPDAAYSFDAVTIKPDDTGRGHLRLTPDSFSMGGMPAWILVRTAYGVLLESQVEGLPGWAKSENIAVEAKIDPETTAALNKLPAPERWKHMQLMLQAMLVDRFALKVHRESRDLPIYVLTVAKGGLKITRTAPDDEGGNARYDSGKITAHQLSVQALAANLSFTVGREIVNKTGLDGGYDFTLDYAPDGADPSDTRPSIFTAIEEQLGLKLEPARGPVDVIVVDHIERPTAN